MTTRRAGTALLAALVLGGVVLALSGFRGNTRIASTGKYINDIKVTANGVYKFSKSTTGAAATVADMHAVDFLDIFNGTATEAVITIWSAAGAGPGGVADSVLVYVPAVTARSWPGATVDSVRVTATFGGAAIILGGMD